MSTPRLGDMSVYALFRHEVDSQAPLLVNALLALEAGMLPPEQIKTCMRCAHSLKGAARMIDLGAVVTVTHAMEGMLVRAQEGELALRTPLIDALLAGADLIRQVAYTGEADMARWTDGQGSAAREYVELLAAAARAGPASQAAAPAAPVAVRETLPQDQDRMLGLAGESLVASRWL